jgi:ribose transport system substrate-binding protein
MASVESRLIDIARSGRLVNPITRRTFVSLLASAGIVATATACGEGNGSNGDAAAATGDGTSGNGDLVRGRTYCQVTTLANDFFVAFDEGAQQFAAALGLALTTVEDDANVNTAIGQVGTVQAAGDRMLFGTPATEAQAKAVIDACQNAGIYYGSAYTSPPFVTPADADHWVRFITPPEVRIARGLARALFE